MPDWISHILIALIIVYIFNIKTKSLVILGALLPDLLLKITALATFMNFPFTEVYWFLLPLHLPIGTFLSILTIAPLFKSNYKKTIILISIGALSHYLADALSKGFIGDPQLMSLFPLSWNMFSFNLLWANQYYIILIITIIAYFLVRVSKIRIKHHLNL